MIETPGSEFIPNILLVEDSLIIQKVVKFIISTHTCHLSMAACGYDALTITDQHRFDIILMDIGLGDMDGFEVTQQIREKSLLNKETPIFALTAHDESDFHGKALDAQMDGYFVKPLNNENVDAIFLLLNKEIG